MPITKLLRISVHIGASIPVVWLLYLFTTNQLTANPIQALEQRTGVIALNFLVLSLSCTPLADITGYRWLTQRKQALGVYGFFYALCHFLIFLGLDYGFNFGLILADVGNKLFILLGLTALLLLVPLAITSLNYWKKRLGKDWKRLHKLAYIIPLVVAFHFLFSVKGNLSNLQGNILQPIAYGTIILFLLVLRIPLVRNSIKRS